MNASHHQQVISPIILGHDPRGLRHLSPVPPDSMTAIGASSITLLASINISPLGIRSKLGCWGGFEAHSSVRLPKVQPLYPIPPLPHFPNRGQFARDASG